jgi:hypothetical protein
MNGKHYVARDTHVAARMLGGGMMVMSARDSTLYSLNEVATVIWQAADGSTTLDQIVADHICTQFEVPPDAALKDAETLVNDLAGHGILITSEKPIVRTEKAK